MHALQEMSALKQLFLVLMFDRNGDSTIKSYISDWVSEAQEPKPPCVVLAEKSPKHIVEQVD